MLAPGGWELAAGAASEAAERPDPWAVADSALEVGIAALGLLGGAAGARAVGVLGDLRAKARAFREVVAGNERLKQREPEVVPAFKAAHENQSPATRQAVAVVRAASDSPNGST